MSKNTATAADDLMIENAPLARWLVDRFVRTCSILQSVPIDDLHQEGYVAMLLAARSFDPSRGVRFSSYASVGIRNRLLSLADQLKRSPRLVTAAPVVLGNTISKGNSSVLDVADEIEALLGALQLPERDMVEGYYLRGERQQDLGALWGCTDSAVNERLRKALTRLCRHGACPEARHRHVAAYLHYVPVVTGRLETAEPVTGRRWFLTRAELDGQRVLWWRGAAERLSRLLGAEVEAAAYLCPRSGDYEAEAFRFAGADKEAWMIG